MTIIEATPLGTGGAIVNAVKAKRLDGNLVVLNGDTFFPSQWKYDVEPHQSSLMNLQSFEINLDVTQDYAWTTK